MAGVKSSWNNSKTVTIRVPEVFSERLKIVARLMDRGSSIIEIVKYLISTGITLDESFSVSTDAQVSIIFNESDDKGFVEMIRKLGIEGLYYITHLENVSSILENGILSHSFIEKSKIDHKVIYNSSVIDKRKHRNVTLDKTLWDFANLYFQPRNAMLYSLVNKLSSVDDLAILCIKNNVLKNQKIFITDGNAASLDSNVVSINSNDAKELLREVRNQIDTDWWNTNDGSKRKIMAECLVPERINSNYIQSIYVPSIKSRDKLLTILQNHEKVVSTEVPIVPDPKKFFQPESVFRLRSDFSIVKGDMFFSKMQTLTISVNCVGAMGKGLASTAKYRFPDVYVKYEDLCKAKKLKLGFPFVHKRESSVFDDLYDEYLSLDGIDKSSQTWFLLFPTKDHWRSNSSLSSIETGLKWLYSNYRQQKIVSLAIPALGCGLGQLSWQDVGPLMCKYLYQFDIPVAIYLPTEKDVPEEFTSRNFLLSQI